MRSTIGVIGALLIFTASSLASAQDQDHPSFAPDVIKRVILDPTTYTAAVVAWEATRLDWRSSQVLFRNGSFERNPRFTISGRADDTAIGYAAGNRQILTDAITNLQFALVNNASQRAIERLLMPRYPSHRRLLRTIGLIERSAMAAYWSYRLSASHFREWRANERRAQQLGDD